MSWSDGTEWKHEFLYFKYAKNADGTENIFNIPEDEFITGTEVLVAVQVLSVKREVPPPTHGQYLHVHRHLTLPRSHQHHLTCM